MPATAMVHVRIDEDVKEQATEALASMGLTVSAAVKIFLRRVAAEKALPFDIKVPNAETRAAMLDADRVIIARSARFATSEDMMDDLEKTGDR